MSKEFLDEDVIKVPGQNYVLLSFVGPDLNQKSDKYGLKVRGVFDTRTQAEDHAKRIIAMDPTFHVFVADMYRWLLMPPNAEDVEEQVYPDTILNELINGHKESQQAAKEFFNSRVNELVSGDASIDTVDKALSSANATPSKRWADEVEASDAAPLDPSKAETKPSKSWADVVDEES